MYCTQGYPPTPMCMCCYFTLAKGFTLTQFCGRYMYLLFLFNTVIKTCFEFAQSLKGLRMIAYIV